MRGTHFSEHFSQHSERIYLFLHETYIPNKLSIHSNMIPRTIVLELLCMGTYIQIHLSKHKELDLSLFSIIIIYLYVGNTSYTHGFI